MFLHEVVSGEHFGAPAALHDSSEREHFSELKVVCLALLFPLAVLLGFGSDSVLFQFEENVLVLVGGVWGLEEIGIIQITSRGFERGVGSIVW